MIARLTALLVLVLALVSVGCRNLTRGGLDNFH